MLNLTHHHQRTQVFNIANLENIHSPKLFFMNRSNLLQTKQVPGKLVSFYLVFLSIVIFSCNDTSEVAGGGGGGGGVMTFATASKWPYFKLDAATISANTEHFAKNNKSIIFKHLLSGIKDDGKVVMKLYGFPSKNHSLHGRLTGQSFVLDTLKYKNLDGNVILGNNYIDWKAIGDIIFSDGAHTTLRTDFAYILFEPMNSYDNTQHPLCTTCAGHLWYRIAIYKTDGSTYPIGGGGGIGSSNPSPPADPTP